MTIGNGQSPVSRAMRETHARVSGLGLFWGWAWYRRGIFEAYELLAYLSKSDAMEEYCYAVLEGRGFQGGEVPKTATFPGSFGEDYGVLGVFSYLPPLDPPPLRIP